MPVGVTVHVTVKRGLSPELLHPALVLGMERALKDVAPTVRGAIRPPKFASALRFIVEEPADGLVVGTIGLPSVKGAMVARFMETGTAPHSMAARDTLTLRQVTDQRILVTRSQGKPMRFKIGDRWISKYSLEHPGMAPRPWLQPSLDEHAEGIAAAIGATIEHAYEEPADG
jgi:hypothetical protein